jgi:hypothetical protein
LDIENEEIPIGRESRTKKLSRKLLVVSFSSICRVTNIPVLALNALMNLKIGQIVDVRLVSTRASLFFFFAFGLFTAQNKIRRPARERKSLKSSVANTLN